MDRNRTEGVKNQVKGSVKETAGKLTGNKSGELEGKLQKKGGEIQEDIGEAADRARKDDRRH